MPNNDYLEALSAAQPKHRVHNPDGTITPLLPFSEDPRNLVHIGVGVWIEQFATPQPKHLEYLDMLMANKDRLNVAACYGCGKVYTRSEIARTIWPERTAFACGCGYIYNVKPYRPLTFWEMVGLDKQTGAQLGGVDVAAVVRALYEVLYGD